MQTFAHRLKNWPSRFAALQQMAQHEPFAWGTHDCCLWAADSVLACTGVDPAQAWRGTYHDEAGGMALLESLGGLHAVAALGGPPIDPRCATVGDVGILWIGAEVLAVCGGGCWLLCGPRGIEYTELPARMAWGVGSHA